VALTSVGTTGPDTGDLGALIGDLRAVVGPEHVLVDPAAQRRILKDFHYYSPLLEEALANMAADAVVRPATAEELEAVVGIAVRHRVPLTVRGAGTGNYGQSLPLERGVVIDVRRFNRIVEVADDRILVEAGAVLADAEEAARARGRELAIMSTTYRVATASGFVAGGSGGIGSVMHGRLWDGNVPAIELLTAEDPPRRLSLEGDAVNPVLHTYGTVGVISRVALRLVPARDWTDHVVTFASFRDATRFAWEVAADEAIVKRLCSLQEAPIPSMFEPVRSLFTPEDSAVLLILDRASVEAVRALAERHGGTMVAWPARPAPTINQFPYSHTILWTKKYDPASTWLQAEFAFDRDRFFEQLDLLTARFGGAWLHHVEFARLANGAIRPGGIAVIRDASLIDETVRYCGEIGMAVMNPHSYVVQEGGMVGNMQDVLRLKERTDPYRLLNPGKVERSFYGRRAPAGAAS
jgi:FAD/FMN-containing dehydrogenase